MHISINYILVIKTPKGLNPCVSQSLQFIRRKDLKIGNI